MGRRGFTNYSVGATWKGTDQKSGKRAKIWLAERNEFFEVWKWSWCYSDGSTGFPSQDWGTSYRICKDKVPVDCRMKRVK